MLKPDSLSAFIAETSGLSINNMESDTPRTDALMQGGCIATNIMEHARQLERELNEVQALSNKLVKELGSTRSALDQMTQDAVNLQRSLSNYTRVIETL